MDGNQDDEFERQYRRVSASALWVAALERILLAPLDGEERKQFRRSYLAGMVSAVDDVLQSEPILRLLQIFAGWVGGGSGPGAEPTSREGKEAGQGGQERETAAARDGLGDPATGRTQPGPTEPRAKPTAASGPRNGVAPGARATRGGPGPDGAAADGASHAQLLEEVREMNRRLQELLALQSKAPDRNGDGGAHPPKEARS
jgi:hypothetical protein